MNFPTRAARSKTSMSMSQELRSVGQGLESLEVEDFDLREEGHGYFALGIPRARSATTQERSTTGSVWNALRESRRGNRQTRSSGELLESGPDVLRILFTTEGILKLEAAGISRRNPRATIVPDFTKLAQALRMVGERLDDQAGRLLMIRKRNDRIIFTYATTAPLRTEEWRFSELYERWLQTYRHRAFDIAPSR